MPSLKERSKLDLPWKGEQSYLFGLLQINHKAEGAQSFGILLLAEAMKLSTKLSNRMTLGHEKALAHDIRDFSGASRLHDP